MTSQVPNEQISDTGQPQAKEINSQDEALQLRCWFDTLPDTECTRLFKATDWSLSSLGIPQTWPPTLRFAVNLLFTDSRGASIYWGRECLAIYNDVYKPMAGEAHPRLMSKPFWEGYPELWAGIKPIFDGIWATGTTIDVQNMELFTDRNGFTEETYFIGQFIPLKDENGQVVGAYNTVYESTAQVMQERRKNMINSIAAMPESPLTSMFDAIKDILMSNGRDIPMFQLYSLEDNISKKVQTLQLRISLGVDANNKWVPADADLETSQDGIVPYFRTAYKRKSSVLIPEPDLPLSSDVALLMKKVKWSGFQEPSKVLVVSPVTSAGNVLGFFVMGTNPRRTFTNACQQFVDDLTLQIAATWASAVTAEQARKREARLIRNLERKERHIRYMADYAPIGMLHLKVDGCIEWANEYYFELTGHIRGQEEETELAFLDCFMEEDRFIVSNLWKDVKTGTSSNCQARLKRIYQPPTQHFRNGDPKEHESWVLVQGFPLTDENELNMTMMCFTDISGLKWAESVQSRAAAAAKKAKQQQEEFIDTTSHEMRNPLSAMMQSAESITLCLQSFLDESPQGTDMYLVKEAMDASTTILACGMHQKRIVDDVLMLSRLENDMLSIKPTVVEPLRLIQDTFKMLDADMKFHDISTRIFAHRSLSDNFVSRVICDPARLVQVLLNLLSNALKHTRGQNTRLIEVTCGATPFIPTSEDVMNSLQWSESGRDHEDLSLLPEWGNGQPIYVYFLVRDTGSGMSKEETPRLFGRFSQGSATTYDKYGGSGLGLSISRELTEKQGGQIGVSSVLGHGTTFGFFVKARRPWKTERPTLAVSGINLSPLSYRLRRPHSGSKPFIPDVGEQYSILIVEDNLINQRILSAQLRKLQCIIHIADHGGEALDFLETTDHWTSPSNSISEQRTSIDVILMDWNMPHLDGVACTRRIRALEHEGKLNGRMTIIGITANARIEQTEEARIAGMDDVMSKPFLVGDLMARIRVMVPR